MLTPSYVLAQPAETIASLERSIQASQAEIAALEERNAELQSRNDALQQRQAQYEYVLPMSWVGAALAVVLLAGFLAGLWWTDYRSRRRHGGIRIY